MKLTSWDVLGVWHGPVCMPQYPHSRVTAKVMLVGAYWSWSITYQHPADGALYATQEIEYAHADQLADTEQEAKDGCVAYMQRELMRGAFTSGAP